ncbi:MAG: SBBP repeat-containing protein [Bacteroidota bacterium]
MKYYLILLISLLSLSSLFAQSDGISINATGSDPDPSAMLDVQSSDKGMLMPRMTKAERDAIVNPAAGLMIYNLNDSCFNYYTGESWIKDCGRRELLEPTTNSFGGGNSDQGNAVTVDDMGNRYVTGVFSGTTTFGNTTLTSSGNRDVFVMKLDPAENVLWAIQLGGGELDEGNDISTDLNGNSYITGTFRGTASFGNTSLTSNGDDDAFVAKVDPNGQVLWALNIGGTDEEWGKGIATDDTGNSYVTGLLLSTASFGDTTINTNRDKTFVTKIDPNGQILWAMRSGGVGYDNGEGIAIDASGNSYITGIFGSDITFGTTTLTNNGGRDVFIAKLDPSGQPIWAINVGGSTREFANEISVDGSGNAYVIGFFENSSTFGNITLTSNGVRDGFVTKVSSSGQVVWAKQFGGPFFDEGYDIASDADGNSYLTGIFYDDATFGNTTLNSAGTSDIFVSKIDPAGQWVWTRQVEGSGSDLGRGITANDPDYILTTGFFIGSAVFGNRTLTSAGSQDVYLWKLNRDGNVTESRLSNFNDGDTDAQNEIQTLSLSGTNLSISGGNTQDLSSLRDNLGNHTATQNLVLGSHYLSGDGDNEGIKVNSSGNVVVGQSSPESRLHVRFPTEGETSGLTLSAGNSNSLFYHQNGDLIIRKRNQTNQLVLDQSGRVGVGTAKPATAFEVEAVAPSIRLTDRRTNYGQVTGSLLGEISWYTRDASNTNTNYEPIAAIRVVADNGTVAPDGRMDFQTGQNNNGVTTRMTIDSEGNVGVGTTNPQYTFQVGESGNGTVARANSWSTWSDSTLKRDFEELPHALTMLSHLNGYYYYWKEGADSTRQVGVMAQEVQQVLPELVETDSEGILSVDYNKLSAVLIEAIQEQQRHIESVEAENTALQSQVQQLQSLEARLQTLEATLTQ